MTSLFTLKGKIKADFKLIDKLILNLSDHDRKQIYKFLDKQIEISYEAGLKRAISCILGNIKLTEEQIKTLKTELQIIPPQGRKRKYGKNN